MSSCLQESCLSNKFYAADDSTEVTGNMPKAANNCLWIYIVFYSHATVDKMKQLFVSF